MTGRFSQCDDTCTTDCGHGGAGRAEDCRCGHGIEDHHRATQYCTHGWGPAGSGGCRCEVCRPATPLSGDAVEPLHPLGRRCCGAPDSTACHQRGLCVAEGVHPSVVPEPDGAVREAVRRVLDQRDLTGWDNGVEDALVAELLPLLTARPTATVPEVERYDVQPFDPDWIDQHTARVIDQNHRALALVRAHTGELATRVELLLTGRDAATPPAQRPEVERPANQLDDHWDGADGGLRARVEALIAHIDETPVAPDAVLYAIDVRDRLRRALDGEQ